jgi:hypothetical protein
MKPIGCNAAGGLAYRFAGSVLPALDIHAGVILCLFREVWMRGSACCIRENGDCDIYQVLLRGGTSDVRELTGWSRDLRVTADADDVVALVGLVGLRMLADRTGLTRGLSRVLARPGFYPGGPPGDHAHPARQPDTQPYPINQHIHQQRCRPDRSSTDVTPTKNQGQREPGRVGE